MLTKYKLYLISNLLKEVLIMITHLRYRILPLLIMFFSFSLISCSSTNHNFIKESISITSIDPSLETELVTLKEFEFYIPTSWCKLSYESDTSATYAPINRNSDTNSSNVNVTIKKDTSNITLNDIIENLEESVISNILNTIPSAKDFVYDVYTSSLGDVLVIDYNYIDDNTSLSINATQFLLLYNNFSIAITSSDIGDKVVPSPDVVSKNILDTLKLH
jgi:hypothetical protein